MKLSLIIPIYNAEKYIDDCLSSIVQEALPDDVEVILINDGSLDNSYEICKKWSEKNDRIQFISQKNSGVSAARNVGIKIAKGEYVAFIDADDYVSLNYLKIIIPILNENFDLIMFDHYKQDNSGEFFHNSLPIKQETRNEDLRVLPLTWKSNQVWDKIYKKSIIEKNNILFPHEMKTSEDLIFILQYFSYIEKWIFINEGLYYYRYVPTSAVRQFEPQYVNDLKKVQFQCEKYIIENQMEYYMASFYKVLLWQYIDLLSNCSNLVELRKQLYQDNDEFLKLCCSSPITKLHAIYQRLLKYRCIIGVKATYLLSQRFHKILSYARRNIKF